MDITPYDLALRFLNMAETEGKQYNPQVLAMLQHVDPAVQDDETAWCSAFVDYIAWLMNLPQSHSLAARSWLKVGKPKLLENAFKGYDIVILMRGEGPQPPADVINAPGHVGFFSSQTAKTVSLLGGNQGNKVSIVEFPKERVLGVRRLWGA